MNNVKSYFLLLITWLPIVVCGQGEIEVAVKNSSFPDTSDARTRYSLSYSNVSEIEPFLMKLMDVRISQLVLVDTNISEIPPSIYKLKNVYAIQFICDSVSSIDKEIINISGLNVLECIFNEINFIYPKIDKLEYLEMVDIDSKCTSRRAIKCLNRVEKRMKKAHRTIVIWNQAFFYDSE